MPSGPPSARGRARWRWLADRLRAATRADEPDRARRPAVCSHAMTAFDVGGVLAAPGGSRTRYGRRPGGPTGRRPPRPAGGAEAKSVARADRGSSRRPTRTSPGRREHEARRARRRRGRPPPAVSRVPSTRTRWVTPGAGGNVDGRLNVSPRRGTREQRQPDDHGHERAKHGTRAQTLSSQAPSNPYRSVVGAA